MSDNQWNKDAGYMTATYGEPIALPALEAIQPTVSGFSSGASMTSQLLVIYSDFFRGAGIMAGGPYGCVSAYNDTKLDTCSGNGSNASAINTDDLLELAYNYEKRGLISRLINLQ